MKGKLTGTGRVPDRVRIGAADPRPESPDFDAVPFTGNYSDIGDEEELRRDYLRDLEAWERRQKSRQS